MGLFDLFRRKEKGSVPIAGATNPSRDASATPRGVHQTAKPQSDVKQLKANMAQFAQAGNATDFLRESLRMRGSEIAEAAAEILVSDVAFAETLAKELAVSYTYV